VSEDQTLRPSESVEVMFRASYRSLVGSLAVAAGDVSVAEDAVQEAFARAHIAWRKVGHYDDPVAWVRRVAINLIKDHHRRESRRRTMLTRLADPEPCVQTGLPFDLAAVLAELSFRQRMAVVLHYLDGLNVAETAAAMGISEGSVKTHLARGREGLRPVLEEQT